MTEFEVVRIMLGKGYTRWWPRLSTSEKMLLLGAACFLVEAETRNPTRTATQMAHRLHAAYTRYCIEAMQIVRDDEDRPRSREEIRHECRAWGDESLWGQEQYEAAGARLYAAFAGECAKKSS